MQQIGIYEQLITQLVASRLNRDKFYVGERTLEAAEASVWLSRFLSGILEHAVGLIPNDNNRLEKQIELANQLLLWLKAQLNDEDFFDENLLDSQGKILTALYELKNPVAADLKKYVEDIFPLTGLTQSELFCGSNAGLSLETELKREILSSDKIYWLVSFIKWTGIRIFRKELEEFTRSGRQLKVITTSYMGATDAKAVEFLATLANTEIKLSYNTQRERLHAKSYLFLRNTGFHTGYIGSSNLSHSALTSGLEWNLKITSQEIPRIINKSLSLFETYWASNDFARFLRNKSDAKFLFIAHRQEILKQAQASYRGVLRNGHFGELWVAGAKSEHYRQLFASIRTLNNQLADLPLSADYYDYIMIDEVHHIAASSYRAVLEYFTPKILMGLTATPERHDGSDILADFGGVIAAEIRLPEAINRRHLCPFQYFAIDDDTDLRSIPWIRGRYDIAQLTNLYTHNHVRVNKIVQSLQEIVTDIGGIKALAFCVSREHADFMCKQFLLKGINSDVLTSDNSDQRQQKQQALRSGEINVLFVVDIFNEGVDIPEVDTLLFLRPTESLTIFLQQLGRGLRLFDDKECCTVLDFVGNSRPEYDFAEKFRALVGKTNRAISDEIKQGFPHAPLGCRIELSKRTQEMVLSNIRKATVNLNRLIGLIRKFPSDSNLPLTLPNFLKIHPNLKLEDIYKRGSWTRLVALASSNQTLISADEALIKVYESAIKNKLLSCDCFDYLQFLRDLTANDFTLTEPMNSRMAVMCHYDFWQQSGPKLGFATLAQSLKALDHSELKVELTDLLSLLISRIRHEQFALVNLPQNPLKGHARYTREQILAGFAVTSFGYQKPAWEGVLMIAEQNIELLFVTLNKNEKQFSPTTMYHDYAINEQLFHWQSQNSARPESGKGLSYIQHKQTGKRLFLFVREQSKDEYGSTMGFVNFGEVEYVSHHGSQPMSITWQLDTPMPPFMWKQAAKLAIG